MVPSETGGEEAASEDAGERGGGDPLRVSLTEAGDARMDRSGMTSGEAAAGDGGAARDSDLGDAEIFDSSHASGQSVRGTWESSGDRPMDAWRSLGSESRESCFSSRTSLRTIAIKISWR
jgi:hypothetical protein